MIKRMITKAEMAGLREFVETVVTQFGFTEYSNDLSFDDLENEE